MLCRVTHDRLIIGKSSDKTWSTKGGNGNPFPVFLPGELHEQYEKAKRYDTENPFRSVGVGVLLEKSGEIAPERMKRLSQSGPGAQLWRCLVVQVKSDAVKNDIA